METPVLVGVAQISQRTEALDERKEPVDLMIDASRAAAEDAGCPKLAAQAGSIRVIRGYWPYQNPARAVGEALGSAAAETALTPFGGNFVQTVVNRSVLDIQAGSHEVILITGAECGHTRARLRRAGAKPDWRSIDGTPDLHIGEDVTMGHPAELALGIDRPIRMYPIMETARRHHLGEAVDAHIARISELWASFSAVAAENPHAWLRQAKTAAEIRSHSAANRPVSFPYPKFMNSNSNVDQGAALILCSERKAQALGVPRRKWVYPWAGADAHDHYLVSNRDNLHSSPAIRLAARRALEWADWQPAALDHVDLYSCFPIAVQVAAAEVGLNGSNGSDAKLPLTVTGGLTFAGGPLNNYVMHAIARMAEVLRGDPGGKGLVSANGGYLTKHAIGLYSTQPPPRPFRHEAPQAEVDALPARDLVADHKGQATVEGYSVMYGPEGPEVAHIAGRLGGGERTWANCRDADTLDAMIQQEFCGRSMSLNAGEARF
ncbi:MAG: acetyl-CoA acetyltransferase [Gammaproteobacteria bacterium]|nr:acetyl-CoA acetyltransferase [Gammaproteobacteria bacterium]